MGIKLNNCEQNIEIRLQIKQTDGITIIYIRNNNINITAQCVWDVSLSAHGQVRTSLAACVPDTATTHTDQCPAATSRTPRMPLDVNAYPGICYQRNQARRPGSPQILTYFKTP